MCSAITTTRGRAAGELDRTRFWKARFTRIYPIYLLSLLLSLGTLGKEYGRHTHAMFWTGVVLTPLLLQGWIPAIATFLNTPAWTMSAEAFYYVIFPWLARRKRPEARGALPLEAGRRLDAWAWFPARSTSCSIPDGIAHPDRWSYGPWLWALKYTPYAHLASFIFGVMLAELDELIARDEPLAPVAGTGRLWRHLSACCALGPLVPYAIIHDGLLMPLFGCIILGLAGENPLAHAAWACARWSLWARPATAFTCCTSTCGT